MQLSSISTQSLNTTHYKTHIPTQDRKNILAAQYILQKKGKTFGSQQYRKFCIRQGKPYQLSFDNHKPVYKQLPLPTTMSTQFKESSKSWSQFCKDYPVRLSLQFEERSPVYIYFLGASQSQEIKVYLLSLNFKNHKVNLCQFAVPFKSIIIQEITSKIKSMSTNLIKTQKPQSASNYDLKTKSILRFMNWMELQDPSCDFINRWAARTQFKQKTPVETIRIKVQSLKSPLQLKIANPSIKLWVLTQSRQLPALVKQSNYKDFVNFVSANQNYLQIPNCNTDNQFQLEVSEGTRKWKSQRMKIIDILKTGRKMIRIPLSSTQPYPSALLNISLSSELEQKYIVKNRQVQFTPNQYSVIEELIGAQYNDDPKTNYDMHMQSIKRHQLKDSQEIQFFRLKRYIQSLEIQKVIQKSYQNEPAFRNLGTQHRGTVIYKYYVNVTRGLKYYDVEKLLLQHGNFNYRRFFNCLKRFDNALRINFTSKIYYLLQKILQLVYTAPVSYWNSQLFQDNYLGRQSAAFFISIVLIFEVASNYCLVGGKGLSNNSLLMHYTTKIHLNTLYQKLSQLQINIETLFGIYSASLFAQLFEGQAFYRVLDALILQSKSKKYDYNLTIIGLFLSLLSRMESYQSVFESPQNFIFGLKILSMHVHDQSEFCYGGDLFIQKMRNIINNQQFLQISNQIKELYKQEQVGNDMATTMIQFFTQFPENQQKIERAYREIHLCINKIEINNECPKLTLYLFQNKTRIFEHQFSGNLLRQLNSNFGVRLQSLNQIIIAIYQDQKLYTQFCQINPRKIPSNYMFQLCLPVERSKRGLVDQSPCYICFQVIIKQESSIRKQSPKVTPKYSQFFFQSQNYSNQIMNIDRFAASFKMSPNNYNLLYTKLGWYNNHFVFPAERLVSIHRLQNNDIFQLPVSDSNFYYQMNKYSRCAFGRAIIVCNRDRNLFIQAIKNGIQFGTVYKADLGQSKGGNGTQLACYTLENVKMFNPTYLQFYNNSLDLPLIDYLSYDPIEYDVLPDLNFGISLGETKSAVIFSTQQGQQFINFDELKSSQIQNTITYRKLKLKSKHIFKFPNFCLSLDNFLHQLRLNIFSQVIRSQPTDNKLLTKWPSHIIIKGNELVSPLNNMPFYRFLTLIYQTKYNIVMQFIEQGKPRFKNVNAISFLKSCADWRKVEVLCQINTIYKYYLVEDYFNRKKAIVKETQVIPLKELPKVKITCQQIDLLDSNSQLYKKIQKLF